MNLIQRFFYGRYGCWDALNLFLAGLSLVLYVADLFARTRVLYVLFTLPLVATFFRLLSRTPARGGAENARFMVVAGPVVRWVKLRRTIHRDKEHRYFKCPNCGQQLRVPRGKGRITVTCRNCGVSFEEKT